jgi:D-inositol-3-phosphate glycosyltransferase
MIAPYPSVTDTTALHSGVAAYTERLSGALADQGMSVHVLAPELGDEPRRSQVGGVTVDRSYRRGAAALPIAATEARRTTAPIVHLQHETFLFGGPSSLLGLAPALAALRGGGRGPVVTMHQVVDPAVVDSEFTRVHRVRVPHPVARVGLSAVQRTVRAFSAATVVHEHSFERIVPEAHVVPLGLDVVDPLRSRKASESSGVRPHRLTALCFGFVCPYKGLEVALEAAAIAGDAVDLIVAGGSHPRLAGRDPYAEGLHRRYQDTARFVGYVPEADVATWFGAADVLLLPYPRPFASSGPYAQALGFGTPVLCSPALARCVDVPEAFVAPNDPAGLAQRLVELASDRRQLEQLGAVAREQAAGRTWTDVARRHVALYEEVIDARRTVGRSFWPRQSRG